MVPMEVYVLFTLSLSFASIGPRLLSNSHIPVERDGERASPWTPRICQLVLPVLEFLTQQGSGAQGLESDESGLKFWLQQLLTMSPSAS